MRCALTRVGLFAVALSGCDGAFGARVDEIVARVVPPMYECPDRAWPGAAFQESGHVVFHSSSEGCAIVLSGLRHGLPRLAEVELDAVPLGLRGHLWDFGEFQGETAVGISLDDTLSPESGGLDPAIGLTLHEAFHALSGQREWPRGEDTTRSIPYPATPEPRLLRRSLVRALRSVVLREEGAELGHAAFWFERYTTEARDEAERLRDVDRTEGSAQYFQLVGTAIAEVGCGASDEAIEAAALSRVDEHLVVERDPEAEPYMLGVLAGLVLRRAGVVGWEAEVEAGATFAELALSDTPPVPASADPDLEASVAEEIDEWNERAGRTFDPFVAALSDPSTVRVSLRATWSDEMSVFRPFVILRDVAGMPEALEIGSVELDGDGARGRASNVPAVTGGWSISPCDSPEIDSAIVLAVPRDELVERDGVYSISTPSLTLDGYRGVERASGGAAWLCPAP